MSWGMPPPNQWNPAMAMTPDMHVGSYTPEQWTAMQQQNWQQWAQWQQQYAQWQNQYGEKYAEQVQAMQAMTGMPPLPPPNSAPPPAPPPPDKPPPPPPHENNQPLYGQSQSQPAPVPAPTDNSTSVNTGGYNNTKGNNQNWSYGAEPPPENPQSSVNAEALKKLAEEERLFDIQFQKWEEEIDKWRRENVNHPDKQAYEEYEQKFETCRQQLLERRQQMKQKRARLLGQTSQSANTALPGNNNLPPSKPPLPIQSANNNFKNLPVQGYKNQPPQNSQSYQNQPPPNSQSYHNPPPQNSQGYQNQPPNNSQSYPNKPQQNFQSYPNKPQQNSQSYQNQPPRNSQNYQNQPQNYQGHQQHSNQNFTRQNNQGYEQYDESSPTGYNEGDDNIEPQDMYESYENTEEDYSSVDPDHSSFLTTSTMNKGIPGLDLVPDIEKVSNKPQEVIDITEDHADTQKLRVQLPDYSKISKGINNILGDETIMNILSMVRGQNAQSDNNKNTIPNPYTANNNSMQQSNQLAGHDNAYDNQYGDRSFNREPQNYPMQNLAGTKRMYNDRQRDMQAEQYTEQNAPPRMAPPHVRPNLPPPRTPVQDISIHRNSNDYSRGPNDSRQMLNNNSRGIYDNRDMRDIDNKGMYENKGIYNNQGSYENRDLQDNQGVHGPKSLVNNQGILGPKPLLNLQMRPKWIDEPLLTPCLIVEYEHKPLRLKARDFIEPVHMFDYNHKSKDDEYKDKDFEKEVDGLFTRKPKRIEKEIDRGFAREQPLNKDYERRPPRDELREDYRSRVPPKDDYEDRRRMDSRFDERRRDDRDKFTRRDDHYRDRERERERGDRDRERDRGDRGDRDRERNREREMERDFTRDKFRDKWDDSSRRSLERDSRKRGRSKDSEISDQSKKSKDSELKKSDAPKHIVMIDDIIEAPGRDMRPEKIVIIMRGPPGSGKSYLAKLIRDREAEYGGAARIMSIDDYFMQEGEIEEKDPVTGKIVKKPSLKYEYDEKSEETYINSLKRAFKRSLTDGYFTFLIFDAVNDQLKSYADIWNYSRQNGFQVYICKTELDAQTCFKRNIHNRTLDDIQVICARFFPTPAHHIELDPTTLLQSAAIPEVQMEDAIDEIIIEDDLETEVESVFTSKWEKMDDAAQLARLDGTSKPLRPSHLSMEDYLQLDDWKPNIAKPGKKTVRWADLEERREQEKMRAIGFVVGQTDWNRMTDPTMGSSALTQTKYIERVRRNY